MRYPVLAPLDGREFERLHVDVNAVPGDDRPVEQLRLRDLLGFAGIEPPTVPAIPVAQHLAEKLHAYCRDYGSEHNTRPRDLYDMLIIASSLPVPRSKALHEVCRTTFVLRRTSWPPALPRPSRQLDRHVGHVRPRLRRAIDRPRRSWSRTRRILGPPARQRSTRRQDVGPHALALDIQVNRRPRCHRARLASNDASTETGPEHPVQFSFVLADGRLPMGDRTVDSDGRLYHFDLPRGVQLMERVSGTVEGETVSVPAIDLLAAIKALHGGGDGWLASGARAHLAGATKPTFVEGRRFLKRIEALIESNGLLAGAGTVEKVEGARRSRWRAVAAPRYDQATGVRKWSPDKAEAEAWLQQRAFAFRVGWTLLRTHGLFDDPEAPLTLEELLDVAEFFGEPPSVTLTPLTQDPR